MIVDWKVWVENRAYAICEAEGRPEGRHEEHWYRLAPESGRRSPTRVPAVAPPSAETAATATKPRQPVQRARKEPVAASIRQAQLVRSGGNQAKKGTQR